MSLLTLSQNANENLALNKPTAQSSVYHPEQYGYDPHGACNGKKTGEFGFHTLKEDQPWWQIDLQGVYQLSEIKIYNRINDCKERACTLNVLLSQDALNWELCYSNDQENIFGGIDGKPLIVNLPHKLARFVRLQLRENESLHLDEVEIYGVPVTPDNSQLKSSQDEATLSANFYAQASLPPSLHVMQNLIMNMLSKLRIHDTDLGKIRVGSRGDGGYVIPNDLTDIKGVVSIGIGGEVSFDQHFAEKGVKVFQYDHTIEAPPVVHENFVFNKLGWGTQDGDGFITLSKIIENNGLENSDIILKFDVENAEWDALFDVSPDLLKRFRIITCELHGFDTLENISVFQKVNRVINLLTTHHTVVHIHPNNCCGIALVAGVVLPKLIEFSFLRNDRASFYPSHESIPSSLDYPNVQSQPEIILTPFHINLSPSDSLKSELNQNEATLMSDSKYDSIVPNMIHCIGDSHSSFFSGQDMIQPIYPERSQDSLPFFRSYRLGSVLAYNLCEYGTREQGREKIFHLLDNCIPKGEKVMLCFGEIDCRFHLLRQAQVQNRHLEELVNECVDRYYSVICEIKEKGYSVMVWNAIPSAVEKNSINNEEYPFYGSMFDRNQAARLFNEYLSSRILNTDIIMIDIFNSLVTHEGLTKTEYFFDGIHLSQKAMPFVIKLP